MRGAGVPRPRAGGAEADEAASPAVGFARSAYFIEMAQRVAASPKGSGQTVRTLDDAIYEMCRQAFWRDLNEDAAAQRTGQEDLAEHEPAAAASPGAAEPHAGPAEPPSDDWTDGYTVGRYARVWGYDDDLGPCAWAHVSPADLAERPGEVAAELIAQMGREAAADDTVVVTVDRVSRSAHGGEAAASQRSGPEPEPLRRANPPREAPAGAEPAEGPPPLDEMEAGQLLQMLASMSRDAAGLIAVAVHCRDMAAIHASGQAADEERRDVYDRVGRGAFRLANSYIQDVLADAVASMEAKGAPADLIQRNYRP